MSRLLNNPIASLVEDYIDNFKDCDFKRLWKAEEIPLKNISISTDNKMVGCKLFVELENFGKQPVKLSFSLFRNEIPENDAFLDSSSFILGDNFVRDTVESDSPEWSFGKVFSKELGELLTKHVRNTFAFPIESLCTSKPVGAHYDWKIGDLSEDLVRLCNCYEPWVYATPFDTLMHEGPALVFTGLGVSLGLRSNFTKSSNFSRLVFLTDLVKLSFPLKEEYVPHPYFIRYKDITHPSLPSDAFFSWLASINQTLYPLLERDVLEIDVARAIASHLRLKNIDPNNFKLLKGY